MYRPAGTATDHTIVTDHIAGMTDRYAVAAFEALLSREDGGCTQNTGDDLQIKEMSDIVDVVWPVCDLKNRVPIISPLSVPWKRHRLLRFRQKQFFHCFGCGAGGDVYTFLMKREGLTIPKGFADSPNKEELYRRLGRRGRARQAQGEPVRVESAGDAVLFQTLMTETNPRRIWSSGRSVIRLSTAFGLCEDSWTASKRFLTAHSASVEDAIEIATCCWIRDASIVSATA